MNRFDEQEEEAVLRVIRSGCLSGYIAGSMQGGKEVQALEREWEEYFNVKHAIAVNSATSGLFIAGMLLKKLQMQSFTMSACIIAPQFNGKVNLVDIEPDYYCIDPAGLKSVYGDVVAVDLFGQPYDQSINNDYFVVEDASQAIGATYKGRYAGTLGDIGIFSLNYHKHITCGEGGIIVTDSDFDYRIRMMMNHGEVINIKYKGLNFRMTEIQAAVARVQLKKLKYFLEARREWANMLTEQLKNVVNNEALPKIRPDCTHSWYLYPVRIEKDIQTRNEFILWLDKHGYKYVEGYTKPLYVEGLPETVRAYEELICVKVDS